MEHTEKYKSPDKHWPAFAKKLRRLLGDAIRLWRRRDELSPESYASRRTRLTTRLEELIDADWDDKNAKRLVKRLRRHRSERGADCQAVLMSLFRTLKRRGHDPIRTIINTLGQQLLTDQLPPLPTKLTSDG